MKRILFGVLALAMAATLSACPRDKDGGETPAGGTNTTINNNILRAQDIIRELDYSLNVTEGGELAIQLRRLYDYFDRVLQDSNLKKEPTGISEVLTRLAVLRDAWATMLQQQSGARPTETPANAELTAA